MGIRLASVLLAMIMAVGVALQAGAEIRSETVEYRHGETRLEGQLYWDDRMAKKRPAVLVVHEWWGLTDSIRTKAHRLAELGYVALAADMYGQGKVAEHPAEAKEWMGQITENVEQWRQRAMAGLDLLRNREEVDPSRMAAIGFCFGGATVMQLAYGGADLQGVISFHGSLPAPDKEVTGPIQPSVLAFHGSADSFVPIERVQEFQEGLDRIGADWHFVTYGGARHGFSIPEADAHGMENLEYDPLAADRSWKHMRIFFKEIFAR
jgi:dienelactone hydrolase